MTDMRISEVRAMLALFARSEWKDLHVRTPSIELFIAKPGGAANPIAITASDAIAIRAPHVATLLSLADVGAVLTEGQTVAVIELLGEKIEVPTVCAGLVTAHRAMPRELVEYDQILLTLAP